MENMKFEGKTQEEIEEMLIKQGVEMFMDDGGHEQDDNRVFDYFVDLYKDNDLEPDLDFLEKVAEETLDEIRTIRRGY